MKEANGGFGYEKCACHMNETRIKKDCYRNERKREQENESENKF